MLIIVTWGVSCVRSMHRAYVWMQMAQAGSKAEKKRAGQELRQAAEEGAHSVPAPASAPLWLQLFPAFQALHLPCLPLARLLTRQLLGLPKAPPEVHRLIPPLA